MRHLGPGKKDLSTPYGPGTSVEVKAIDGDTATVRVRGQDAKLVKGAIFKTVGGLSVGLVRVSGENVSLLILAP